MKGLSVLWKVLYGPGEGGGEKTLVLQGKKSGQVKQEIEGKRETLPDPSEGSLRYSPGLVIRK